MRIVDILVVNIFGRYFEHCRVDTSFSINIIGSVLWSLRSLFTAFFFFLMYVFTVAQHVSRPEA